jgi:hypothetical protein
MSIQSDLRLITQVIERLDENRAAAFSYDEDAFNDDDIDGVELFDKNAHQNIPKAELTDYNPSVTTKGVRTQGASIPRMAWNHYIGRFSYNINKLIQKVLEFLKINTEAWAHNAAEYDDAAQYKTGDMCFVVEETDVGRVFSFFRRHALSPEVIQGIPPEVADQWEPVPYKFSSSLLPFTAPGYRHRFTIIDLRPYSPGIWYPVVTRPGDFETHLSQDDEGPAEVVLEAYCHDEDQAEMTVRSRFTGLPESSTDVLLNYSYTGEDGSEYTPESGPIGYSKLVQGKQAVLWLKGGRKYAVWNSYASPFTLELVSYDNGLDAPIFPSQSPKTQVTAGTIYAKLHTPPASAPDEAVALHQVQGALPLPFVLHGSEQLDSVRRPGSYVALTDTVANTIDQTPFTGIGSFTLIVTGDPAGVSLTVQRLFQKETGNEYCRVLSNAGVLVPWFLAASPAGTNLAVSGLYAFRVVGRQLMLYYRDGDEPPDFHIDASGHLIAGVGGAELDLGSVLGPRGDPAPAPSFYLDADGHLFWDDNEGG